MANELINDKRMEDLCESLYEARQKFFRAGLNQLVAYKVYIARTIVQSSLYGQYGSDIVGVLSQKTSIKASSIYDAIEMYKSEHLTPKKEIKFIREFGSRFSSWNDYLEKKFKRSVGARKSIGVGVLRIEEDERVKCLACPIIGHCSK